MEEGLDRALSSYKASSGSWVWLVGSVWFGRFLGVVVGWAGVLHRWVKDWSFPLGGGGHGALKDYETTMVYHKDLSQPPPLHFSFTAIIWCRWIVRFARHFRSRSQFLTSGKIPLDAIRMMEHLLHRCLLSTNIYKPLLLGTSNLAPSCA